MASFAMKEKNLLIENQQLELANSQKQTWIMIGINVLLGLILLGGFIYRRMRLKRQSSLYKKEKLTQYLLDQQKELTRVQEEQVGVVASVAIPEGVPLTEENQDMEILSEDKRDLYLQMINAIETQRLYLNPNLDMNLVVTMLGTNKLYLYKAITSNAPVNFRNIINRYRVEEAKRLIEQEVRENTFFNIENVYSASGFNSTSSFYRIFRLYTGLTPNEYKQEYALELREQESSTTD
jgi:AraC-like DNA-binding protein